MLKATILIVVGLLIALMLCGCSGGTTTDTPAVDTAATLPAATWFPLKVGNSWTYKVTHNPALITPVPGEKAILTYTGTISVPGTVSQGGLSWFKTRFAALIGSYDSLARHDLNGLLGKDMPVTAPREYAIKKPIAVGTTWKGSGTGVTYRIASLTKTVKVPKGTFTNCMAIVCLDTPAGTKTVAYYKAGVGKVLVVCTKGTQLAIKYELKAYKLK